MKRESPRDRRVAAVLVGVTCLTGLVGCHNQTSNGVAAGPHGATASSTVVPTALATAATTASLPSPSASSGSGPSSPSPSSPGTGSPTDPACSAGSTSIPAGHYAGPVKATLTTQLRLSTPGGSVPDAGGGTEVLTGKVDITSDGTSVTGSITLSGLGLSQVGLAGDAQVHSVDNGDLTGRIFGAASSPAVTGTLSGEWASLDAPVANSSGSASNTVSAGLHVTNVSCDAVSGDAIAMFAQFAAPVAQYLTFGGSGTWTARRT